MRQTMIIKQGRGNIWIIKVKWWVQALMKFKSKRKLKRKININFSDQLNKEKYDFIILSYSFYINI